MKNFLILNLIILIEILPVSSQTTKKQIIPEIKYENLLSIKNYSTLSKIAEDVRYIQLETKDDCLISARAKYYFFKSFIFVCEKNFVLKFSSEGKFLKRIGNPGRGPGEINSIWSMTIIPDKMLIALYDATVRKLSYFNFEGDLVATISTSSFYYVYALNGSKFIAQDQGVERAEKYTFLLVNESGDTLSTIKNTSTWINNSGTYYLSRIQSLNPFYIYQDKPYFKTLYNDTVYTINENKITPGYSINLGKYTLPENKMIQMLTQNIQSIKNTFDNYYYSSTIESGNIIFLRTQSFGTSSANLFLINNTDYSGISKGPIFNDFDGGPVFWPDGYVNDKEIYSSFNALSLTKNIDQIKSNNAKAKYPEKQKQLIDFILKLNPTDNPILMIVKLKQ